MEIKLLEMIVILYTRKEKRVQLVDGGTNLGRNLFRGEAERATGSITACPWKVAKCAVSESCKCLSRRFQNGAR